VTRIASLSILWLACIPSVAACGYAAPGAPTPNAAAAGKARPVAVAPAAAARDAGDAEPEDAEAFDHAHEAWTMLLRAHVADGRVDYTGLLRRETELDAYLRSLEAVDRSLYEGWSRRQRMAFWINAYNAYTVRLILDHWPVASIKDVGGWFSSPFRKEFIAMDRLRGGTISLDTIEHEILRKEFPEARVHFALVCASKGCPALRRDAFRADDLDAQLDDQARRFLADPAKNRIDVPGRTLHLSSIFRWFEEDFERDAGTVPAFVARHVDEETARAIGTGDDWRVKHLDYDWSLNGS